MAETRGSMGLILALMIVSLITVGAVAGAAWYFWPGQGRAGQGERQMEMLAKSVAMVSTKILLDFEDPMERQFALEKTIKDIKESFPEVGQVWVVDDKNLVLYSTKADDMEKPYRAPTEVKNLDPAQITVTKISPETKYVATPLRLKDRMLGGIRMTVAERSAAAAGDSKDLVVIIGAAALILGLILPPILVRSLGRAAALAPPAGPAIDANMIRALKAEEASINARLEAARKELAQVEELRSQQNFIESQIEAMRKQQFEETYKLEGLQKEAAELAKQIEQRKAMLAEPPEQRMANLSQEEQELVQKIEGHRKEEMMLARKIEEIRKKVIDLDRRIEARRKEEAEIGSRIEAKRREEQALNQRLGG